MRYSVRAWYPIFSGNAVFINKLDISAWPNSAEKEARADANIFINFGWPNGWGLHRGFGSDLFAGHLHTLYCNVNRYNGAHSRHGPTWWKPESPNSVIPPSQFCNWILIFRLKRCELYDISLVNSITHWIRVKFDRITARHRSSGPVRIISRFPSARPIQLFNCILILYIHPNADLTPNWTNCNWNANNSTHGSTHNLGQQYWLPRR